MTDTLTVEEIERLRLANSGVVQNIDRLCDMALATARRSPEVDVEGLIGELHEPYTQDQSRRLALEYRVAAALARQQGEIAKTRCPIGLDDSPDICSASSCYECVVRHGREYADRALAAEAKCIRLIEANTFLADQWKRSDARVEAMRRAVEEKDRALEVAASGLTWAAKADPGIRSAEGRALVLGWADRVREALTAAQGEGEAMQHIQTAALAQGGKDNGK